ncbi:MAG: molecular chaperone DnaJ [Oscillospiraceae bacterium]|nr:molecular chaperone DnaJ [Oscillospiraceae bacterium]
MPQKEDYYKLLGVGKGASEDEIKKAYRRMAKQYHPDLNKDNKSAEAKFKEVNEAYEVLSDKEKRARYDQFGHAGVNQNYSGGQGYSSGSPFESDFDLGDLFGSFFGGFGGSASGSRRRVSRGSNIEVSVSISFEESAKGCSRTVNFERVAECEACGGVGAAAGSAKKTCSVCRGSGQVVVSQRTAFGVIQTMSTCSHCHGEGSVIEQPCAKCGGKGRIKRSDSVEVQIPAGVDSGQILNVRSKGNVGVNGGGSGDLHISVNVKPHQFFERNNDDIWCELPITFVQASLGDDVVVPTLEGKVTYHVHEGTQHGDVFKLKGRGIPHLQGRGRGDQMIRITVEVPKHLSEEQRKILKKFDSVSVPRNYQKKQGFFERLKSMFS